LVQTVGTSGRNSDGSETDESTDSDQDNDECEPWERRPGTHRKFATICRYMNGDIDSLYQVSVLIKRPGFNRRYLHSTGKVEFDSRIAHYAEYDVRHVVEKLRQWEQQKKLIPHPDSEVDVSEQDPPPYHVALEDFSDKRGDLIRRLATANTKRREQLSYWSRHPDQPYTGVLGETTRVPLAPLTSDVEAHEDRAEVHGNPGSAGSPHFQLAATSEGQRSAMTKNTFTIAALSDALDAPDRSGLTRTIYSESTVGNKRSNRVPDVPRAALDNETFTCPYCLANLMSKRMRNRNEWK
jgi:hypothetical protein